MSCPTVSVENIHNSHTKVRHTKTMVEKFSLTFNEVAVLKAFGDEDESSVPQLAVRARLTPTEMNEAISKLAFKDLVETSFDGYFASLTLRGSKARLNWEFDKDENGSGIPSKPQEPYSSGTQAQAEKQKDF